MIATAVPVQINVDAQERIEKTEMRKEFEQMLERALRTIPSLERIEVTCPPTYEHDDDVLIIEAFGDWGHDDARQIEDELNGWMRDAFMMEFWSDTLFFTRQVNGNEATTLS